MAGNQYPVFSFDFGRVAAAICFDVNFPEVFRIFAIEGAEVILHPTVYSMYGEVGWESVIRARAIDNCLYVCPVNYGNGEEEPWMPGMGLGRSGIIGPDGLTLAETGRHAGVAAATVDLDRPRMVRAMGIAGAADFREQMWRHRRPETYGKIAGPGEEAGRWESEAGTWSIALPAGRGAVGMEQHHAAVFGSEDQVDAAVQTGVDRVAAGGHLLDPPADREVPHLRRACYNPPHAQG